MEIIMALSSLAITMALFVIHLSTLRGKIKKEEAVKFTKWIAEDWVLYTGPDFPGITMWKLNSDRKPIVGFKTTEELYNLFKEGIRL
jgi:hypothetical protein